MDNYEAQLKMKAECYLVEMRKKKNNDRFSQQRCKQQIGIDRLSCVAKPAQAAKVFKLFEEVCLASIVKKENYSDLTKSLEEILDAMSYLSPDQHDVVTLDLLNKDHLPAFFDLFHTFTREAGKQRQSRAALVEDLERCLIKAAVLVNKIFTTSLQTVSAIFTETTLVDVLSLTAQSHPQLITSAFLILANMISIDTELLRFFVKHRVLALTDQTIEKMNAEAYFERVLPYYIRMVARIFDAEPMVECSVQQKYLRAFLGCYVEYYETVSIVEFELINFFAKFIAAAEEEDAYWLIESPFFERFCQLIVDTLDGNAECLPVTVYLLTNLTGLPSNDFVEAIEPEALLKCLLHGLKNQDPLIQVDALLLAANVALTSLPVCVRMIHRSDIMSLVLSFLIKGSNRALMNAVRCIRNIVCFSNNEAMYDFLIDNMEIIDLLISKVSAEVDVELLVKLLNCLRGILEAGDVLACEDSRGGNIFAERILSDRCLVETLELAQEHRSQSVRNIVLSIINDYFEVEKNS